MTGNFIATSFGIFCLLVSAGLGNTQAAITGAIYWVALAIVAHGIGLLGERYLRRKWRSR